MEDEGKIASAHEGSLAEQPFNIIDREEAELISVKIQEVIRQIKEKDISAVVFLDKSARPIAWALHEAIDALLKSEDRPEIKFINIGPEKHSLGVGGRTEEDEEEAVRNLPQFSNLKKSWGDLNDKNVLIFDDFVNSGVSLSRAEDILRLLIKPKEVHTAYLYSIDENKSGVPKSGMSWRTWSTLMEGTSKIQEEAETQEGITGVMDNYSGGNESLLAVPNTEEFRRRQIDGFMAALRKETDPRLESELVEDVKRFSKLFEDYGKQNRWQAFFDTMLEEDEAHPRPRPALDYGSEYRRYTEWTKQARESGVQLLATTKEGGHLVEKIIAFLHTTETFTEAMMTTLRDELRSVLNDVNQIYIRFKQYHESPIIKKSFDEYRTGSASKNSEVQSKYTEVKKWNDYFEHHFLLAGLYGDLNLFLLRHALLPENERKSKLLREDMHRIAQQVITENTF
ncbi:MAG: hypothetical protein A2749_01645 [Parcubacteria group bacterium RIFCSPHIGHO2_01_FULL_45_26]|nr:MAG: hypothetical protein A2749_01645 [Parcubacteria group bacterium RIFCSPHIGHO2_01_FULL_45_26]